MNTANLPGADLHDEIGSGPFPGPGTEAKGLGEENGEVERPSLATEATGAAVSVGSTGIHDRSVDPPQITQKQACWCV